MSVDPDDFKKRHPKFSNEPYFIRRCGTKCVLECVRSGSVITMGSSRRRGTVGLILNNEDERTLHGITAFHVLHPTYYEVSDLETAENDHEKADNDSRNDLSKYREEGGNHWLSDVPYCVNETTEPWYFGEGQIDKYLDVGIIHRKSLNWRKTEDFKWPSFFNNIEEKDFHKLFLNYQGNTGNDVVVFHNGAVSGKRNPVALLDSMQSEKHITEKNQPGSLNLIDHVWVSNSQSTINDSNTQIDIEDLKKYYAVQKDSDSESESDGDLSSDSNEQSNGSVSDDDGVSFTEQIFIPDDDFDRLDDDDDDFIRFTKDGDSGCIYYIKIKEKGKEYRTPIAVHRGAAPQDDPSQPGQSYGSRFDKVLHFCQNKGLYFSKALFMEQSNFSSQK